MASVMGIEIERKFLVREDAWRAGVTAVRSLRQGYLAIDGGNTARVRTDGLRAWITIKGRTQGISRAEFEYEVPLADAEGLLALCGERLVEKRRHLVPHEGRTWEVDEFFGANAGLVLAEIELAEADEWVTLPPWLGQEVSADPRYTNARLATHPFGCWEL